MPHRSGLTHLVTRELRMRNRRGFLTRTWRILPARNLVQFIVMNVHKRQTSNTRTEISVSSVWEFLGHLLMSSQLNRSCATRRSCAILAFGLIWKRVTAISFLLGMHLEDGRCQDVYHTCFASQGPSYGYKHTTKSNNLPPNPFPKRS